MAVWLGGLVILGVVLLPRRRAGELAMILPRWSHLAFDAVSIAIVAGVGLLLLISPRWTALPASPYGRFLLVKLALVATLLAVARRARDFVWDRLPVLTDAKVDDLFGAPPAGATLVAIERVSLQPLVTAVTAELCLAASILAAAAALAGRAPPR
jgi:copper transport protein